MTPKLTRDGKISDRTQIPSLSAFFSGAVIVFLIYAFFSGISTQFYASFLFFFYSFTKSMWISVVMLGAFQTLLMIPFRIVRIILSVNIKDFQQNIKKSQFADKSALLKKKFKEGSTTFSFYSVDFIMQLVSYTSMAKLFLKNFYSIKLDPGLLYNWVKYPEYPLVDHFFKIPYPVITNTIAISWGWLIFAWILVIVVYIVSTTTHRSVLEKKGKEVVDYMFRGRFQVLIRSSLIITLVFLLILFRNWPHQWAIKIFSGDISIPNRAFNTVTAWSTFFILLWHRIPVIVRQSRLAFELGVSTKVIERTQVEMFREILITAGLVGLGAFFITNQIPSAFELSIFTLEVISLLGPVTLDKWILKNIDIQKDEMGQKDLPENIQKEIEEETKSKS